MADSLYDRYMAADRAHREHEGQCTSCSPETGCETGRRLYESLARLQDAYLNRLRNEG
ncbi:hypothetical protein N8I84_41855 (plasmid) [Streptomyces cynarae]|uniref:Uncharacterized protein n=1 Tax=Streptomyces cynarae TaxID=2981134 RepID=A0ABY6EI44_9ACTN|nr:hypothetical protein [Streptomyces cynarae]UXY24981.1 hypothetical protein N8I84_41855 [Streptomyces cynarae]